MRFTPHSAVDESGVHFVAGSMHLVRPPSASTSWATFSADAFRCTQPRIPPACPGTCRYAMVDREADIRDDTRWLTYKVAGRVLGIDPDSVARRARRLKWPRLPGNDGMARVAIPEDILLSSAPDATSDRAAGSMPDNPGDTGGHVRSDENNMIKALEGEATALREALARERERTDRAEAAAAVVPELRERLGRAEGEAAAVREQLKIEQDRAEASARHLEAARAELAAWMAGGALVRAWRAFLHRRGRP